MAFKSCSRFVARGTCSCAVLLALDAFAQQVEASFGTILGQRR